MSNDIVARFIHLPLSTDSEFTISKASPVSVQLDELFLYQISKFRKTSLTLNQGLDRIYYFYPFLNLIISNR